MIVHFGNKFLSPKFIMRFWESRDYLHMQVKQILKITEILEG